MPCPSIPTQELIMSEPLTTFITSLSPHALQPAVLPAILTALVLVHAGLRFNALLAISRYEDQGPLATASVVSLEVLSLVFHDALLRPLLANWLVTAKEQPKLLQATLPFLRCLEGSDDAHRCFTRSACLQQQSQHALLFPRALGLKIT